MSCVAHCHANTVKCLLNSLTITSSQSAVESLSSFQNAASVLGMHISWHISWPKTKVQNLGTGQPLSDVSVDAHHVECVDNFTYLGSVQSSDGYSRPNIRRRIALAASVIIIIIIIRQLIRRRDMSIKSLQGRLINVLIKQYLERPTTVIVYQDAHLSDIGCFRLVICIRDTTRC